MPAGVSDAKTSKLKKDENRVKRRSLGPRGQSQSCHQCRQSIFSTNGARDSQTGKDRLKCSICTRFWCEKCLENRYGIHKGKVGTNWMCPFCSGQCNCSVCRRKEGKLATGVLSPLVRNAGYSCVSEFLDKGTDEVAKCLHWKASSLTMSRENPLMPLRSPAGGDRSGYFTKSMQLSVEKLNPSMLKRGAPSLSSSVRQGVKRRCLHHTLYSISVEEDDDIGDTPDVKSGKHSEMTSGKLVKSNCPKSSADRTPGGMESSKKVDVATEGNNQLSEKLSEEIRSSSSFRCLTPPNKSCYPPVIGEKQKCDQLSESVMGDLITQAQTCIIATEQKEPQDKEASGGIIKKLCTMQVHVEDKASVTKVCSSDAAVPLAVARPLTVAMPITVADVGSSSLEIKTCDMQESSHGMQLMRAKNVHSATTSSDLGGPSEESHGPAHVNYEVSRPAESMAGNMAIALNNSAVSKEGFSGKVKLDHHKAEKKEKTKLKLKEERAILKMKAKEDAKNVKMKMKEKIKEEREIVTQKLKEEKKLKKLEERKVAQERKRQERQKEKEEKEKKKQDMQKELKELKLQKKKDLAEAIKLPSVGVGEEQESSFLEDDSVQQCLEHGISDLPPLHPLDLGVSFEDVPRFLFVCEFLYTFGSVLKLRRAISLSRFQALLPNGRGMSDVYQCLLQAVLEPANHVTGQSSPSQPSQLPKSRATSQFLTDKKQPRDVEKLVAEYLHASGRNGFISTGSGAPSLEQSLVMLEHLCTEALDSKVISDHIQSSFVKMEEVKRKKRLSLKEKIRDCSEELERLYEEGVSLEELKEKRDQFAEKLINLRRKLDCERLKNALILRNPPLGTDRHNRVYWKLQCSEGLVVETPEPSSGQSGSEVTWAMVESRDEVKEFIKCLHPRGRREGLLLEKIKDAVGLYDNYMVSKKPTSSQATQ